MWTLIKLLASREWFYKNRLLQSQALPAVEHSIWQLSYYNNAIACALLLPLILVFGELPAVHAIITTADAQYWALLFSTGICGFAIGYVTGLQIQVNMVLILLLSSYVTGLQIQAVKFWIKSRGCRYR